MHYIINPLEIKSTEERELLQAFLKETLHYRTWKNGHTFHIQDNTIELTHRLILKEDMVNDIPIFYVVSQHTQCEEIQTKICPIECELSFPDEQSEAYHLTKQPLLIKIKWFITDSETRTTRFRKTMHHEYKHSKLLSHLGAEKNICSGYPLQANGEQLIESVMVLNKMPGIELFYFIEQFFETTRPMPSTLRMRITLEILRAFEEQVYNQNLYHGDLKTENMVIDFGIGDDINQLPLKFEDRHTKSTIVNIIDLGGAEKYGKTIKNFNSTNEYCAPELRTKTRDNTLIMAPRVKKVKVVNEKPDMFAIGKIIGLLWNYNCTAKEISDERFNRYVTDLYQTFFSTEPSWFTIHCLGDILALVRNATRINPVDRLSLDDANMCANKIAQTYFSGENYELLYARPSLTEPEQLMALHGATSTAELSMYQEIQAEQPMNPFHITPDTVTASQSPLLQNGLFSPRPIISGINHVGASVFKPS